MRKILFTYLLLLSVFPAVPADFIHESKGTAARWNRYVDNLLLLHQRLIADKTVRVEKHRGGYGGVTNDLKFYSEENFYDTTTGQLISSIKWETRKPKNLHMIEVLVRDAAGRISREYTASYLPVHRRAPYETTITVHRYSEDLHSEREFDASGNRLSETCSGRHRGMPVRIYYDEYEIPDRLSEIKMQAEQRVYMACFGSIPGTLAMPVNPLDDT